MNESVVINSMWRLPKKSAGVTQRSFFFTYASVYVAALVQQLSVIEGQLQRTNKLCSG